MSKLLLRRGRRPPEGVKKSWTLKHLTWIKEQVHFEQPALEVVLVAPKVHHSWLESQVMRTGRLRFMQVLQAAGILDR